MRRGELLILMAGASAVNYFGRTAFSIAGPEVMKEFQFTEAQLGEIFSAFSLGYALLMIPAGVVADKWGAAKTLGLCGIASAALLAGLPYAGAMAGFMALRFAFGAFSAVLYPACGNLTAAWFSPGVFGSVQGVVIGAGAIGTAATPMLVTWMMERGGWRGSFHILAIATLLFFLIFLWRGREGGGRGEKAPADWAGLVKNYPVLLLAAQGFFVGYYYNFADYWSYYYFREVRHLPVADSALFTTLLQVFGVIMMPLGGWASDKLAPRVGRKLPATVVLALAGAALSCAAAAQEPVWVLALLTAAFGLTVSAEGAYWWAVLEHGVRSPGAAYGLANTTGNVAQFVAPLVFPWIAAQAGWSMSVHSAAAALVASAVLWAIVPNPATR